MGSFVVLNQNRDFRRLYGRGKVNTHPALVSYLLQNRAGVCRVGITVSKKLGCAVERNRMRRIIKEAYRQLNPQPVKGYDIVFVARSKTINCKTIDVKIIMEKHLKKYEII